MRETIRQQLEYADAQIAAIADTFKHPEKYCKMTDDEYGQEH